MNRRRTSAVATSALALLVAVALAPLATGASTAKTVVRIDLTGAPQGGNPSGGGGRFTLKAGSRRDAGTQSYSFGAGGRGMLTLLGKRGDLTLRTTPKETGLHVDSEGLDLWMGTWTVVSGTGAYADVRGSGGYLGIVGPAYKVAFHLEGFFA